MALLYVDQLHFHLRSRLDETLQYHKSFDALHLLFIRNAADADTLYHLMRAALRFRRCPAGLPAGGLGDAFPCRLNTKNPSPPMVSNDLSATVSGQHAAVMAIAARGKASG